MSGEGMDVLLEAMWREVAASLFLSPKTVSNNLTAIFVKLEVHDRVRRVVTGMSEKAVIDAIVESHFSQGAPQLLLIRPDDTASQLLLIFARSAWKSTGNANSR